MYGIDVAVPSSRRAELRVRPCRRGGWYGWNNARITIVWAFLLCCAVVSLSVFGFKLHLSGDINDKAYNHYQIKIEDNRTIRTSEDSYAIGEEWRKSAPKFAMQQSDFGIVKSSAKKHRKQHVPCEVRFAKSVDYLIEPDEIGNFTHLRIDYLHSENNSNPSFGGHQTFEEREKSFHASNQTIHCGFFSAGFDLDGKDRQYMNTCRVAVSSCIFGYSDFLRRPASKKISDYSKRNVCFAMFVDEKTLSKLNSDGHVPDEEGNIGLWRVVVVKNLPFEDMRRNGKVPKFLSHRLFPSSRYSIWIDSKMRLNADPLLILEHFLWRMKSEYAISSHYDRRCVWEEVLQNKRLNKYNHSAIDEQFKFYQSDGLVMFNYSDPYPLLPSYVPEGSFIVRAHTPMSNLFSCLWFNEVHRFTSRDQLSFAYTFLKLSRLNPGKQFHLNMFKDCERRALAKLFHHRLP